MSDIIYNDNEFIQKLNNELENRLKIASVYLVEKIKESMYIRGAGKSSESGEAPAVQTESLRKSIDYEIDITELTAKVGVDAELLKQLSGVAENYGFYLEIGTTKMKARPYLRPALNSNIKEINEIFNNE